MTTDVRRIAGFWRRLVALLLDLLLLGTIGAVMGFVAFDVLAELGAFGRVVGFLGALAYFGLLNSRIGGGQTLGKRLLGIRVVDGGGALLSLPRSLLRYCVLGIPFFLNGAPFGSTVLRPGWGWVLSAVVFGGMLSILYLYLFNRRTRRSLHDLAVGSWVVNADPPHGPVPGIRTWRGHLVVVGLLFAMAFVAPSVALRQMDGGVFGDLVRVQGVVASLPGVQYVEVKANYDLETWEPDGGVTVRVRLDGGRIDDEARARDMARRIVRTDMAHIEVEQVTVVLSHGFDLGMASAWRNHAHTFEAEDLAGG